MSRMERAGTTTPVRERIDSDSAVRNGENLAASDNVDRWRYRKRMIQGVGLRDYLTENSSFPLSFGRMFWL